MRKGSILARGCDMHSSRGSNLVWTRFPAIASSAVRLSGTLRCTPVFPTRPGSATTSDAHRGHRGDVYSHRCASRRWRAPTFGHDDVTRAVQATAGRVRRCGANGRSDRRLEKGQRWCSRGAPRVAGTGKTSEPGRTGGGLSTVRGHESNRGYQAITRHASPLR